MVKYVFPLLMIFVWMNTGYSQSDTIMVSEGKNHPEDDKYNTLYKMFVKDQEPEIRHLWKINLVDLAILMPNLDFEQKLGKLWSSDSYLKFGVTARDDYEAVFSQWAVSQQFKFYYNLNRRDRHGKKTNGFSGNYISLNLFAGEEGYQKPGFQNTTLIDIESYYGTGLQYGLQRRIGDVGYLELFAGIQYQNRAHSEYTGSVTMFEFSNSGGVEEWVFSMVYGVKAGFAIGSFSNNTRHARGDDQSIEAKRLWKLNLVGFGLLMPNCGLEFKIAKNWSSDSYFKLGVELKPSSRASGSILDDSGDPSTELEFEQQFKYYLNLIKHDKPGGKNHGFTGDYFSIGLFAGCKDYTYDFKDPSFPDFTMSVSARMVTYGAGIKYGLQRRIGNIGYFDVFAGMNYQVEEVPEKIVFIDKGNGYFEYRVRKAGKQEFMPMIGIRAGFAIDSNSKPMEMLK